MTTDVAAVVLVLSMLKASVGVGRNGTVKRCVNLISSTSPELR